MHMEVKSYPIDTTLRNVDVTLPVIGYINPGCFISDTGPRVALWIMVADPGDTDPVPTRDLKFRLRKEGDNLGTDAIAKIEYLGKFYWQSELYVLGVYRHDIDPGGGGDIPA